MSGSPKVSVVVPIYNVENYLEKCLLSIVNQSLQDIEIIAVNDGSTDGSLQILNHLSSLYPQKIKPFSIENSGLSGARNYALDRASGEYIAFVDSDDYIDSTMLEEMYGLAKKHDADITICNLQKVNESGKILQKMTQIPNMPQKIILSEHLSVFSDIGYFACNKIFKREFFLYKRFKTGMHFEDIQLIPQLLLQSRIIAQTQNYHYQYLERKTSITKTHNEKGIDILSAVQDIDIAFKNSRYKEQSTYLKNFIIFQAVYSYLAYTAYVRDRKLRKRMEDKMWTLVSTENISLREILTYKRFGRNYLFSLPFNKKLYYILKFILRKI